MRLSTPAKPIIHLGQLARAQSFYLQLRALNFTRPAIESHMCGLVLQDKEMVEEVDAVLTATAENPDITATLIAHR